MTAASSAPKKRWRWRWWLLGILLLAALISGFIFFRRGRGPESVRTSVEAISRGAFTRTVSGTGIIEAGQTRDLSFRTSGTVDDILVQEGDRVESGAVLARLDTAALERDLASSRASLQSARADLARINAQQQVDRLDVSSAIASAEDSLRSAQDALRSATDELRTTERLFGTGAASQDELTRAQDAFAQAQRRLNQAELSLETARTRDTTFGDLASAQRASTEATIASLQTTIANLEEQLEEAQLVAPFAGAVTEIGFKTGDTISQAGASLSLVDDTRLDIVTDFDENRATELRPGQAATIIPDADSRRELPATVRRVSPVATRDNNAAQVEVILAFDEAARIAIEDGLVRPGYTVNARVNVNHIDDALLIPLEAISEEDSSSWVYKVTETEAGEGSIQRANIEVLDRNATVAAASSNSLSAGDLIALINLDALEEAETVSFEPLEEAGD